MKCENELITANAPKYLTPDHFLPLLLEHAGSRPLEWWVREVVAFVARGKKAKGKEA